MTIKKFYRLMSINTCFHNRLEKELISIEISPMRINENEYSFPVTGDFINLTYLFSQEKLDYFISNIENPIEINLDDFVKRLEMTSTGLGTIYNHKSIEELRNRNYNWGESSKEFLEAENETIAYKFSHFETALLKVKSNDENEGRFVPIDDIKTIEKENHLVFNRQTLYFFETTQTGLKKIFEAKIKAIEYDRGAVVKVIALGFWALTNNLRFEIEFNKDPLDVFNRSDNNAVITIKFSQNSRWQWSLINGEFLGKVKFNSPRSKD